MKKRLFSIVLSMLLLGILPRQVNAAQLLIPVGEVIGLELSDDTVTVAAYDDSCGDAARCAGLQIGDQILSIDGTSIETAADVRQALNRCDGDIDITVLRGSKRQTLHMEPQITGDGPRLGVYLRQGISGIGTITFFDPSTGRFGTLGHGVSDLKGNLVHLTHGNAYDARIDSIKRGKSGEPGQLKGSAESASKIGSLQKNTPQGVFGTSRQGWQGEPLPVADFSEVTTGSATIRSTVSGNRVQEYSVEIIKIYPRDRSDGRNFLLKVTDPDLLSATGGIVQGMSGSPIIQDGKLVGAVTHVLVNDPTTGYGIFIENMLDAAA